jgi:hypothetical protein
MPWLCFVVAAMTVIGALGKCDQIAQESSIEPSL